MGYVRYQSQVVPKVSLVKTISPNSRCLQYLPPQSKPLPSCPQCALMRLYWPYMYPISVGPQPSPMPGRSTSGPGGYVSVWGYVSVSLPRQDHIIVGLIVFMKV